MGQKAIPTGLRLGIINDWAAKWYSGSKNYAQNLYSDLQLRDYIKKKLANAAVSKIVIQRPAQSVNVTIYTARPGIVIGKKGEDIEKLRKELKEIAQHNNPCTWPSRRFVSPNSTRSWLRKASASSSRNASCSGGQ